MSDETDVCIGHSWVVTGDPLLRYWPEENLAIQVTVESLIRPRFQRWLRDTLMQCEKSQRKRIIIELAEADVGQHISRLQPVIRLVNRR